jgi:outer membrane protein OmpA-like peptidoglycan-associated protein
MSKKESFWIPYADLMTVLMLIFLFIAMAYMSLMQTQKKDQDKLFKDFQITKTEIYNDLFNTFKEDMSKWHLEIDKDLSIKFTNPEVLFHSGSSEITPQFQLILSEFLPKYLRVITNEKYKDKISEIRIEGHTDTVPPRSSRDAYIDNIKLSQDRSRSVLEYFRGQSCYKSLVPEKEEQLQFWLTANGLSYGRTLDINKKLTRESGLAPDNNNSRRVEFRIVTSSEKVIDEALKQIEAK